MQMARYRGSTSQGGKVPRKLCCSYNHASRWQCNVYCRPALRVQPAKSVTVDAAVHKLLCSLVSFRGVPIFVAQILCFLLEARMNTPHLSTGESKLVQAFASQ